MQILVAHIIDIPSIVALLNSAYRGESSKQGWTTEAHLIAGNARTNEAELLKVMQQPGSVMLKCVTINGIIMGCVNLQQQGTSLYLGMLSVSPFLQGKGTGKALLMAAEKFAMSNHCNRIYMTVISVRQELINWYIRNGYRLTGETKPFIEDEVTGKHMQPLEFVVLEKNILNTSNETVTS